MKKSQKEIPLINPEEIQIISIKTIRGNIEAPDDVQFNNGLGFELGFNTETGLNIAENIVRILITVDIQSKDDEGKELAIKASYTHQFIFKVNNLSAFIHSEVNLEIDFLLGATLCGIALSTIRGIILTRTQGTPLEGFIIPVIDPKRLIMPDYKP